MDDKPRVIFIPNNYKTGLTILGIEVKVVNIIQAVVLAIIPFIITYLILPSYFDMDLTNMMWLSFTLIVAAPLAYVAAVGVNGMTLGEFVVNFINFKKKERNTYYNPRVKREILSIFAEEDLREELPREKILAMYNQYKEKMDAKNRENMAKTVADASKVEEQIFFEDDNGFVSKPVEYMTPKEYKAYKKDLAKQEKKALKEKRKVEKQAAKEAKKNSKKEERKDIEQ